MSSTTPTVPTVNKRKYNKKNSTSPSQTEVKKTQKKKSSNVDVVAQMQSQSQAAAEADVVDEAEATEKVNTEQPVKPTLESLAKQIAKYLEEHHEHITFQDKIRQLKTVLMISVKTGDLKTTRIMLANKVDVNMVDYDGTTPLITAIINHNVEMTRLLLEFNANPNVCDNDGWTPLMIAIANNENTFNGVPQDNMPIINMLLENNADISQPNDNGYTPMIVCAMNGEMKIMRKLVEEYDGNVNERDNEEISVFAHALMFAGRDARNENGGKMKNEMIDYLIEKGANIHHSNINNQSPLFLSAHNGYLDMVKYCVEHGIDVHQRDVNGVNSMEQAHSRGNKLIVSYLANKML
jgi:ankyrin repeat protein